MSIFQAGNGCVFSQEVFRHVFPDDVLGWETNYVNDIAVDPANLPAKFAYMSDTGVNSRTGEYFFEFKSRIFFFSRGNEGESSEFEFFEIVEARIHVFVFVFIIQEGSSLLGKYEGWGLSQFHISFVLDLLSSPKYLMYFRPLPDLAFQVSALRA